MKTKRLLEKLALYLNADRRALLAERDSLKKVLKKLKKKERRLKEKLAAETDAERIRKIERNLKIIYVQRRKGVKLLRDLATRPPPPEGGVT